MAAYQRPGYAPVEPDYSPTAPNYDEHRTDNASPNVNTEWAQNVASSAKDMDTSQWMQCALVTFVVATLVFVLIGFFMWLSWFSINSVAITTLPYEACVDKITRTTGGNWWTENAPDGRDCEDVCVDGTGSCSDGECDGACLGQCESVFEFNPSTDECPAIQWTTPVVNSGAWTASMCFLEKCVYVLDWILVPEYPCLGYDHGRFELKKRAARHCMDAISDSDPHKPCMTAMSTCFGNYAVCIYDYSCGRYLTLQPDVQCASLEAEAVEAITSQSKPSARNAYALSSKFSWQAQDSQKVEAEAEVDATAETETVADVADAKIDAPVVDMTAVQMLMADEMNGMTMLEYMEAEFLSMKEAEAETASEAAIAA